MDITDIVSKTEKPKIYEKGTAFMFEKTANWILNTQKEKGKLTILDLGCGPGLYTEIFAKAGHNVTGIDISKNSIEYAKKSSEDKKLDIAYLNSSYLEIDLESDKYDLVVLIYTDLGVLMPTERESLMEMIFRVLKKGGTFIFDVLKDREIEKKTSPKTWEASNNGFWKESPYLALSESFLYQEEKVVLFQHIIVDTEENIETYRFWTHFFSQTDVQKILDVHSFIDVKFKEDILPEGDIWNGDNVIFTMASK